MERGHFEGLKSSYRQTKDGMVISFVIHPNEDPGWLAKAPLGVRLQIGWAEITDEQNPAEGAHPARAAAPDLQPVAIPLPTASAGPKRKLSEMQPSQRAALLCQAHEFQAWVLTGPARSPTARLRWSTLTAASGTPEACADWLRSQCGITSRAQLDTNPDAEAVFAKIEGEYRKRNDPPPHNGSR